MPRSEAELGAEVRQLRAQLLTSPPPIPPPPSALESAAQLAASPSAAAEDVEQALGALAFLALPAENRGAVAQALEDAGADLGCSRGATEAARAALLMLVLRLAPRARLTAADLLALAGGSAAEALECVGALLRARPPRHQSEDAGALQLACARLLHGLTLPDALYGAGDAAAVDTNASALADLTQRYSALVGEVVAGVLARPVLASAVAAARPWLVRHTVLQRAGAAAGIMAPALAAAADIALAQAAAAAAAGAAPPAAFDDYNGAATAAATDAEWHLYVGTLLKWAHNLFLFLPGGGSAAAVSAERLRAHVAAGLVAELALPYCALCVAALEGTATGSGGGGGGAAAAAAIITQQLLASLHSAVALLAVASFKAREVLRPALGDGALVRGCLRAPGAAASLPCLAALLALAANADALDLALKDELLAAVAALDGDSRARLHARLRDAGGRHAMPVARGTKSFAALRETAWPDAPEEGEGEGGKTDDDAPPLCCLTRAPLTDPVVVLAPRDALRVAPGVATRPPTAEEAAAAAGAADLAAYYCERSAAEDCPPDDWVIREAARDDPVVLAAQRATVARLSAQSADD